MRTMIDKDNICSCEVMAPIDVAKNNISLAPSFSDILELSPCAAFTVRFIGGRLTEIPFASKKLNDIIGLHPKDVEDSADPFLSRISQLDVDKFYLSAVASARSMEPWCVDFRFDHYVKGEIWIEWRANPIFKNCELIWDGIMLDITAQKQAQRMQYILENALENMSDGSLVVDRQGNILEANRSICGMLGYEKPELLGRQIFGYLQEFTAENWDEHWDGVVNSGWSSQIEAVINTKLGASLTVDVSSNLFEFENEIYNLFCIRDTTECKKTEEHLQMAANVFEASREGIILLDKENCIQDVNPAFRKITGYSYEEVIGSKPSMLSSGEHDESFYETMWSKLNKEGSWSGEIKNRHKDGRLYTVHLNILVVHDGVGEVKHYIGIFTDISQLKDQEQHLAYHDVLTNLPNRLLLSSMLSNALAVIKEEGSLLGVLCLDLDGFKHINDNYGQGVGDLVLIEVSHRLSEQTRSNDKVARVGGDEFVVLLIGIQDTEECARTASRLLDVMAKPILIGENVVNFTASIGISLHNGEGQDDTDVLIRHADQAMYMAKSSGRNQYVFYDQYKPNDAQENDRTVHELRQALKCDQLVVYYQPIIDLATGRVTKAEALVRWKHPKLGIVPPNEFISIAENGGLINEIGDLVFQSAAGVAYALNSYEEIGSDKIQISINRSPRQFFHRDGVDRWINYLNTHEIPGELLGVEITEGLLLDDWPNVLQQLNMLQSNGISISLDDFGTGYSALSYLTKFKIDYLKIDRSFVKDIVVDADYHTIVNSIIFLAKQLGIQTIGEGVETQEQNELLKTAGCDMVQGYFYAKPMPESEFIEFALTNRAWECDICSCL